MSSLPDDTPLADTFDLLSSLTIHKKSRSEVYSDDLLPRESNTQLFGVLLVLAALSIFLVLAAL